MRTVRLLLKLHRHELLGSAVLALAATGMAIWALQQLTGATPPLACFQDPTLEEGCEGAGRFFELVEAYAAKVFVGMAVLPFLVGILLGAPLVAQEVEKQTATVAWSLSPSRRRWLMERVALLLAVLVLVVAVPATMAQLLEAARAPHFDPGASFQDHGLRGVPLVMRAVASLSLAVLAGAIAGRTLPAILLAAGFGAALALALTIARPFWPSPDSLPLNGTDSNARVAQVGYDSSGNEFLSWDQAISQAPSDLSPKGQSDWVYEHFRVVALGYLPERYADVVARESVFLLVVSIAAIGTAALVVDRRKPY